MDPSAVSFLQNAGLENVFQTSLLAFIGAAVIEKAGIPGHITGTGKHDAQVFEFEAGSTEIGILPPFGILFEILQAHHQAFGDKPEMKHVVGPQAEHGVEILLDSPANRLLDAFFHFFIVRRRVHRGSLASGNKEKNEKNKRDLR